MSESLRAAMEREVKRRVGKVWESASRGAVEAELRGMAEWGIGEAIRWAREQSAEDVKAADNPTLEGSDRAFLRHCAIGLNAFADSLEGALKP